jgi:signal transduction histidine kinase
MDTFLASHRAAIVGRWMGSVRAELPDLSVLNDSELLDSFELFVDEVVQELRHGGGPLVDSEKSSLARHFGAHRHVLHAPVQVIVREYALFLRCVVEHATDCGHPLSLPDCVRLSECLSIGAAEAVREYSAQRDAELKREQFERFAFIAHELRNPLTSAMAAWWTLRRSGDPDDTLSKGLTRSLEMMSSRIELSLQELRVLCKGGLNRANLEHVPVFELIQAASMDAEIDAYARGVRVVAAPTDGLSAMCDRRFMLTALTNVVRNAVKFSRPQGTVATRVEADDKRVLISIDDECGGLLPGQAEQLFEAFEQAGPDRSGFGLGLAIARQAVEACGGTIIVRNRPGVGCTFVIDLPLAP